jgi:ectoine hydroxylase-related dioxygenase (phytanoyl-CoA dioxygenase family)
MSTSTLNILREEMNVYGVAKLGAIMPQADVDLFLADLRRKKREDIERFGTEALLENADLEVVRDLARFGGKYFELLENPRLNEFVNLVLNDKAVVHSYNGIITRPDCKSEMLGFQFHRDQPFFKDTRTSINVLIPLVDYAEENGATEYVPSCHLFKDRPSEEFLEQHKESAQGSAGEAFAVDATLWHRAGRNRSQQERPIIAIKYTLAPFKQQVDYCESAREHLDAASPLVRQRLGWDVRVCLTYEEFREPKDRRKWKTGQYDMQNTDVTQF